MGTVTQKLLEDILEIRAVYSWDITELAFRLMEIAPKIRGIGIGSIEPDFKEAYRIYRQLYSRLEEHSGSYSGPDRIDDATLKSLRL